MRDYTPTQKFTQTILQNKSYTHLANTQYTDDSKVTDHYAIIPTGQLTELGTLSPLQQKVYELIVRRFLSIFYPAAEYQTLKLVIQIDKESLFTSAKVLKSLGFLEVMGKTLENAEDENNDTDKAEEQASKVDPRKLLALADTLKTGDHLQVNAFQIKEGATKPPKRYTSGSMILAMENAGQLIEDEELRAQIKGSGIGTSATRGEILKKLFNNKYLALNKKTQIVTPTMLGEMIYDVVDHSIRPLLNPELTASWEKGLTYVAEGSITSDEYMEKLERFVAMRTVNVTRLNNQYDMRGLFDAAAAFYKTKKEN